MLDMGLQQSAVVVPVAVDDILAGLGNEAVEFGLIF